jgi:hypothetical protein
MTLDDSPERRSLSVQEKLAVSQEEKDFLDTRWAAFLKYPSSALTFEQFREKMRKHRNEQDHSSS